MEEINLTYCDAQSVVWDEDEPATTTQDDKPAMTLDDEAMQRGAAIFAEHDELWGVKPWTP